MISLIIKSYLAILLSVGIGSIFIFTAGLYFIFRKKVDVKSPTTKSPPIISPEKVEKNELTDFTAIAGDDVITTQLDLARAYIEADMKPLAKKILASVVEQGSTAQQEEAQRLLSL